MRLKIQTLVAQDLKSVWKGFDEDLFLKLSPPFPPVKLLQFDGSLKGDKVTLQLNFILFKQVWESLITDNGETENEIFFVDKGIKLPFFLKTWHHRHRLIKADKGTIIADEIEFTAPIPGMELLLYPTLWLQFAYRKPIYKAFFSKE
jgi:ligand-binding SRPBCC domain-containing protein